MAAFNPSGYDISQPQANAIVELVTGLFASDQSPVPGAGGGLPSSATFGLTWDTASSKDMGTYTAAGALAFVSSDTSSVVGGSTFAVVIPAGFNATFDGASNAGWLTGANNVVGLYRIGNTAIWTVNGTQSTRAITVVTPVAPVNTLPTIVTATAGSALVWTGGSATGTPTPTITFDWLTSGGSVVQAGISSGGYTPPAAGSFLLRMTSTNSAGTDTDSMSVTVAAAPVGVPVNSAVPTITGTATVGQTLTATRGTWTNSPTGYTQNWKRAGTNISGATALTYVLVDADAGSVITFSELASNGAGPAASAATSGATAAVAAIAPEAPTGLTIGATTSTSQALTWTAPASNGGSAITNYRIGRRLTATGGAYTYTATGSTAPAGSDATLTASTQYDFVVQATNGIGNSIDSNVVTVTTSAAALTTLRLNNITGAITETGTGPYTYTASTGTTSTNVALTATGVGMAGDGKFRLTISNVTSSGPWIGFSSNQTAPFTFGATTIPCAMYPGATNWNTQTAGAGAAGGTPVAWANGDVIEFERVGTTVTAKISKDSGATFPTVYKTWTGVTGTLYPFAAPPAAREVTNTQGAGVA